MDRIGFGDMRPWDACFELAGSYRSACASCIHRSYCPKVPGNLVRKSPFRQIELRKKEVI